METTKKMENDGTGEFRQPIAIDDAIDYIQHCIKTERKQTLLHFDETDNNYILQLLIYAKRDGITEVL